jgi:hypothetical protein
MDIQVIAPLTTSPLDSARGRGKGTSNIKRQRNSKSNRYSTMSFCEADIPSAIFLLLTDSSYKIGSKHVK